MGVFEQFPYTNFHNLNLDWVLQKMRECGASVEEMKKVIEQFPTIYEKSETITRERKLSPKGDFSGTILGRAANLVLAGIDNNSDKIAYLVSQFSDGQTGLVIDGGFFEDSGIKKNYNGGMF